MNWHKVSDVGMLSVRFRRNFGSPLAAWCVRMFSRKTVGKCTRADSRENRKTAVTVAGERNLGRIIINVLFAAHTVIESCSFTV